MQIIKTPEEIIYENMEKALTGMHWKEATTEGFS
jgi:hypothetical protein